MYIDNLTLVILDAFLIYRNGYKFNAKVLQKLYKFLKNWDPYTVIVI